LPLRAQLPLRSPLFPYTTLFRSHRGGDFFAESIFIADVDRQELVVDRQRRLPFGAAVEVPQGNLQRAHEPVKARGDEFAEGDQVDRKSTRLNSSHVKISYAVFCL